MPAAGGGRWQEGEELAGQEHRARVPKGEEQPGSKQERRETQRNILI